VKLALVTNYPPDKRPLSEYGFHLAKGLSMSNPDGEILVVSGHHKGHSNGELRAWEYGSPRIPFQVVKTLRQHSPDTVLINTHFTSWGGGLANFAGLFTPLAVKMAGFKTITLVHHLPQTIDAKRAGYKLTPLHHVAIDLACRAIASSDTVCFLLERDLEYFKKAYSPRRVELVQHGLLGNPAWCPPPSAPNVLTFGNWGRSKKPEPLLNIYQEGKVAGSLIVAGGGSHTRSGYMEGLRTKYDSVNISFTGYVPEDEVQHLFHWSQVVVFPYEENTGISGVLMQACQYGRIALLKRLPVFEQMVDRMNLVAYFYDDDGELEYALNTLLNSPEILIEGGRHNYESVRNLTMDKVAESYWSFTKEGAI